MLARQAGLITRQACVLVSGRMEVCATEGQVQGIVASPAGERCVQRREWTVGRGRQRRARRACLGRGGEHAAGVVRDGDGLVLLVAGHMNSAPAVRTGP